MNTEELLKKLKDEIYSQLVVGNINPETGEPIPIHPRDLAALGNLVLRLQEREDKLKEAQEAKTGGLKDVVGFPALPPKPNLRAI